MSKYYLSAGNYASTPVELSTEELAVVRKFLGGDVADRQFLYYHEEYDDEGRRLDTPVYGGIFLRNASEEEAAAKAARRAAKKAARAAHKEEILQHGAMAVAFRKAEAAKAARQ